MIKEDISLPVYLFHDGTNYKAYDFLGCHNYGDGYVFRVWAPNAVAVSLVCDANCWKANIYNFQRINNEGVWEFYAFAKGLPLVGKYDRYKFAICTQTGKVLLKADPYAFYGECRENTASIVYGRDDFEWTDGEWLEKRKKSDLTKSPMNVYEVHAGSWKAGGGERTYSYLSRELTDYVKRMGYTHVELMPLSEYPFDGSWGYQACGYFAPTSRYGKPYELKALVNSLHAEGIGVLLDWVPAHFCKDAHGLYEFDGKPLYENPIESRMEHKGWGTRIFDYARNEVSSFLISNALYWINEFHFDGLRVDAVASMLYLDYDRKDGEWIPNIYGGRENLEAIAFFKKLSAAFNSAGGAVLIAEESTAFPCVTKKNGEGLGFDFKWNMGWMNDVLEYIKVDPLFRKYEHDKLTFSMVYAFSENFILPFSHDEVVHLKKSMLDKIFGKYEDKFGGLKTLLGFMYGHPGKKLNYMGYEFGQFGEWNYNQQLDWELLEYEPHKNLQLFVKNLNELYRSNPELYINDGGWEGFRWVVADDRDHNIVVFERMSTTGKLLFICNFSYVEVAYRLQLDCAECVLMLNSDSAEFGGSGKAIPQDLTPTRTDRKGCFELNIPSNACLIYRELQ
ncbi:MAG: 1,4-alpha-glucan branching protein GlgB [Clostridia bacterium]|nr:1,4-alpha-glucan branching protein GlgB [Clostridia bacterium]